MNGPPISGVAPGEAEGNGGEVAAAAAAAADDDDDNCAERQLRRPDDATDGVDMTPGDRRSGVPLADSVATVASVARAWRRATSTGAENLSDTANVFSPGRNTQPPFLHVLPTCMYVQHDDDVIATMQWNGDDAASQGNGPCLMCHAHYYVQTKHTTTTTFITTTTATTTTLLFVADTPARRFGGRHTNLSTSIP